MFLGDAGGEIHDGNYSLLEDLDVVEIHLNNPRYTLPPPHSTNTQNHHMIIPLNTSTNVLHAKISTPPNDPKSLPTVTYTPSPLHMYTQAPLASPPHLSISSFQKDSPTDLDKTPNLPSAAELSQHGDIFEEVEKIEFVNLTVSDAEGSKLLFKLDKHAPMSDLISAYASRAPNVPADGVKLFYDGDELNAEDTPASKGLRNDAVLQAEPCHVVGKNLFFFYSTCNLSATCTLHLCPKWQLTATTPSAVASEELASSPHHSAHWTLLVSPDGKLYDQKTHKVYNYLYYEASTKPRPQALSADTYHVDICNPLTLRSVMGK